MDLERFEKQLTFLREIDKVKSVYRSTILMDASRHENDAEHSWHMAVCAMLFTEYLDAPIKDIGKLLKMIMLHDAIEVYAGDTYAYSNKNAQDILNQREREQKAAEKLFSILPDDQATEFKDLWEEFEGLSTPEAKCARLVDTFMPVYHNYVTQGKRWQETKITKDRVLARCAFMQDISKEVHQFVCDMLEDAFLKGYLPEKYE